MLITVLIDKIYLYDDYAIIFFNTQEKEYKVEVPTIEEAEVRTNDTSAHHKNKSIASYGLFLCFNIGEFEEDVLSEKL